MQNHAYRKSNFQESRLLVEILAYFFFANHDLFFFNLHCFLHTCMVFFYINDDGLSKMLEIVKVCKEKNMLIIFPPAKYALF